MKDLENLKQRYIKDDIKVRVGGIAANLARVSSFLENKSNREVVEPILEESKYFIEWSAPEASFKTQVLFSEIQPVLALWQRFLSGPSYEDNIDKIKIKAQTWSTKLLKLSGLLEG